MENLKLELTKRSDNCLSERASSKIKRALSDRLTAYEAIEAVQKMIAGYANAKDIQKSYIGLMVSIFAKYPRQIVLKAVEPDGIPSTTKFIPTPSDVIAWLEERTRPMHEESAREDRIEEQLAARDAWLKSETDPVSVARRKALADEWLQRVDERAVELSGQRRKGPPPREEVEALMDDAKRTAARVNSGEVKLSGEVRERMAEQDRTQAMDG